MTQPATALPALSAAPQRSPWIAPAVALILLAGLAAYSDSFRGAFIFDDISALDQPAVQHVWPIWPLLAGTRPLVQFTLALNHRIGALWAYHAFNLAVHLLAALALFGVVRRTLTLPALAPRFGPASTPLAFSIALLWMLHPLQTESVTYIIQRMESLMGLFYLLTLYCFIRAATATPHSALRTPHSALRTHLWSLAAVAACALGMASKEVMVSAPLLVLLYDRTFIAGSFRRALRLRTGFYIALAATLLILARQVAVAFAPHADSAGFGLSTITPFEYARSELGVIRHYLALAFWPTGLCVDYGWPVASTLGAILPGALVVGGLLALTVWALVSRPAWGFIGAWFFLVLAPTSSFMPIRDLAFEHRMYLSLAAVVAAAVLAACLAAQRLPAVSRLAAWPALVLVLILAAALGSLTFLRNHVYRSRTAIWQDAEQKHPQNPRAWNYLGNARAAEGRPAEAIPFFDHAIALSPDYADAYYNRGSILLDLNRFADAIPDFDKAIALRPDFAAAYHNRGIACNHLGRQETAIADYDRAIQLNPNFVMAFYNRALTRVSLRQFDLAIRDFTSAIALAPDSTDLYNNRALVYYQKGQFVLALQDIDKALDLDPDCAEAYNNRAVVSVRLNRYDQALSDCTKAIALKPDYLDAYRNRAIVFYRMKDSRKALADMKTFQSLGGRPDPNFLEQLVEAAGISGT